MADLEELQTNLSNYRTQLQQVEATLLSDPSNEDLVKLKADLTEVLELTQDLVSQKLSAETAGIQAPNRADFAADDDDDEDEHSATSAWLSWSVGDQCQAPWSTDKRYYDATIDEILEDDACIVTYILDESTAVTKLSLLKPRADSSTKKADAQPGTSVKMNKKDQQAAQREYKKKKQQKKLQRWKQMEEERESEKNKWLSFNTKINKSYKTKTTKKSIFATPDNPLGRVGVGTCNQGGNKMTNYTQQVKWRK